MFLVNSRSHLFSEAPISSERKAHHQQGHTFSRSYGVILPSSFTQVISSALVFSTCPPVSVWGTVTTYLKLRGFSRKHSINHFDPVGSRHHTSGLMNSRICLRILPTCLNHHHQAADLAFFVTPSQYVVVQEY